MGPGNSNTANNNKIQSFLESLRASRQSAGNRGDNFENKSTNPFKELQAKKESEQKRIELFKQAQNSEQVRVYSAKERAKEERIQYLISKINSLKNSVKKLDQNIKIATQTRVVEATVHEESFLEHILSQIALAQKNINSANTWFEVLNSRIGKKNSYQSLARRKGSAYTQNNEVSIARSVG